MIPVRDPGEDPAGRAAELGVSREAVELLLASDVIDLHLDSFIWTRIFGYELRRRHGRGLLGGWFYSQADLPRVLESGMTGSTWVITTNPFRRAGRRPALLARNLERLRSVLESEPEQLELVRSAADYRRARAAGRHAAWIAIQGGNAFDPAWRALDALPDGIVLRVTVVHLSSSYLGTTSAPGGGEGGLRPAGLELVRRLEARRIFPDLAHVSRRGFFDAVGVHDPSLPLLVTHTGVCGAHEHWRNLDDAQLRAVADSGGTAGIMYQSSFLGDRSWNGRASSVVRHLEYICRTVGEDHASLGSDWDGAIIPPRDLRSPLDLPHLVEAMLRRGFSPDRVQKILGGNFLRVVEAMRG